MGSEEKWYGECHHGITVKNGCWRCENEDLRRQVVAITKELERVKGENEQLRKGALLGPIIGAQTILEQEQELNRLRKLVKLPIPAAEGEEKLTLNSAEDRSR